MSYQEKLKKHLADYKLLELGIKKPGTFIHRGRTYQYDHILPIEDRDRNIFEEARPAVERFFADKRNKRHQYFHHLNSSQALTFNLFFPYFYGGPAAASILLRAFGQAGSLVECVPEAVPDLQEGSNIDMTWTTSDGLKTFCEVKLSEAEFGKSKDDKKHRDKLLNHYARVLEEHLSPSCLRPSAFFAFYQFNRNVWHMVREDDKTKARTRLVFLLPRQNTSLWQTLDVLLARVTESTRKRIERMALEDVIDSLQEQRSTEECPEVLRRYPTKLKLKYCPQ